MKKKKSQGKKTLKGGQGYFAERRTPNALFACGLVVSLMFACV